MSDLQLDIFALRQAIAPQSEPEPEPEILAEPEWPNAFSPGDKNEVEARDLAVGDRVRSIHSTRFPQREGTVTELWTHAGEPYAKVSFDIMIEGGKNRYLRHVMTPPVNMTAPPFPIRVSDLVA
jgi:hypothetical protein